MGGTSLDPDNIDVRTRSMTVALLLARLRRDGLDLAPVFQRRAGIWKAWDRSSFIESLLLRIPMPSLYVAESVEAKWSVIDGVQRVTAIAQFIAPDALRDDPLILRDLEYLHYEGCSYEDLPGRLKTRLDETEFPVHLIGSTTPEDVKLNLVGRINPGRVP